VSGIKAIPGRFAVVGNPIQHSKSPAIHTAFAAQTGRHIDYHAELVAEEQFEAWVGQFFEQGGRGLNVTLPFKTRAFELAEQSSTRAQLAGAANFLMQDASGRIVADNTDGKGLVADMTTGAGWTLAGARVLLIGAGGAVKGVIPSLLESSPTDIVLVNRSADRAESLAAAWRRHGASIQGGGFELAASGEWNVVINGTSTGLSGKMPALPDDLALAAECCCYDMAYGDKPTAFMEWANERGASEVRDGLGMLVEQAAESFFLWLGDYPDTAPVIDALRAAQQSFS
jgi:shikimate dehydrogenase